MSAIQTITIGRGTAVHASHDGNVPLCGAGLNRAGRVLTAKASDSEITCKSSVCQNAKAAKATIDAREIATVEPTVGTYLDSLIDMIDEIDARSDARDAQLDKIELVIDEIDAIVPDVELEVQAPVVNTRPYVCSNTEFMALNALTASARRYWARRAGLALAA